MGALILATISKNVTGEYTMEHSFNLEVSDVKNNDFEVDGFLESFPHWNKQKLQNGWLFLPEDEFQFSGSVHAYLGHILNEFANEIHDLCMRYNSVTLRIASFYSPEKIMVVTADLPESLIKNLAERGLSLELSFFPTEEN